ncbi:MAG: DUF177 domain-containing protein [Anaerolineae bacterium]|nr:DUF177 domain-containing protein [Anaerolineae bacterium]
MALNITDPVKIADDLVVKSINGTLRLSRNKEGILVQASDLVFVVDRECSRCLNTFEHPISITIEELFASPHPIDESEFFVGQDGQLDLAPLLRAEALIQLAHREYCRVDCQGLCVYCGTNLNDTTCDCADNQIDPRMAKLKELLDAGK